MKKLIALLLLAIPFTSFSADQEEKTKQKTLSSPNGRYVFGQISDGRVDQYMLDTQTGKLWYVVLKSVDEKNSNPEQIRVLQQVPYSAFNGDISAIPNR